MKCGEIIDVLETLAPSSYACDWDNVGLLTGRKDKEVRKIFLALDATDEVIEEAALWGADLLLTHHPLIFKPLSRINDGDFIGRRILKLIECGISYYAMHTNFDVAPGCMADVAAGRLELEDCEILEVTGAADIGSYGVGRTGNWQQGKTLKEIGDLVKTAFEIPHVVVYGDVKSGELIKRAAVSPGSGGSMVKHALSQGAQVLITGDMGHHEGIDSVANGMAVIDAGHYGLEHIFMAYMEQFLHDKFREMLEIKAARPAFPTVVL